MKKILHVVSNMEYGGAETMIMNLYRHIDRDKIQFYFLAHSDKKGEYEDEIERLGGKIFKIPSLGKSGMFSYIKNVIRVIKEEGPFIGVHCHTDIQGGAVALAGYLARVDKRIVHSHNTEFPLKNQLVISLLKRLARIFATDYFACGKEAGRFLWGDRNMEKNRVFILKNSIPIPERSESFQREKEEFKKLHMVEDELMLCHVGRFFPQKNHDFLVELGEKLKKEGIKFKLFLIGKGSLEEEIREKVKKLDLEKEIVFMGVRGDVQKLLGFFDLFLLPSRFEGVPLVLLEAQASGLKIIASDKVPQETDLGIGITDFQELVLEKWVEKIKSFKKEEISREKIRERFRIEGYDVEENAKKIEKFYLGESDEAINNCSSANL